MARRIVDWEDRIGRRLKLRDLRVLSSVAEKGSMAKAASQLNMTQPAVSQAIADLEAALVTGVDWIALSFVQRAEDVNEAKRLIRGRAAVMAKIEKPQAIERIDEIIELSDALMEKMGG